MIIISIVIYAICFATVLPISSAIWPDETLEYNAKIAAVFSTLTVFVLLVLYLMYQKLTRVGTPALVNTPAVIAPSKSITSINADIQSLASKLRHFH